MQAAYRPRVVVVGAGFGGLSAAATLEKADVDVLVVDRNNYHGFWPFLYQVATGVLETQQIAYPVRAILRKQRNADFRMAEVRSVDFDSRTVVTDGAPIPYDYLVLAGGSATNFFGNHDLAEHVHGLKDVDEADRLRNRILTALEAAARTDDPAERKALLTFVIVGGGATGVELAGALSLLIGRSLAKQFPSLDLARTRIVLADASDTVLTSFPERMQRYARERLERLGVELALGRSVDSVEPGVVSFSDGTRVDAATVVWAAGVRACDLAGSLDVAVARGGRVQVTPTLNLPDRPEVFVVGDMAYLEGYDGDAAYPMVAQVAIQGGRRAARNIVALESGKEAKPFKYFDKGQMAIIGRREAVVDAFGVQLRGALAWLSWLFLHIMYLVGFKNRLAVLLDWTSVFMSTNHGTGVITRREGPKRVERAQDRGREPRDDSLAA